MSKNKPVGYLHIFAQFTQHDEARIVGTRLGLEALASAVAHALKCRDAESDCVFVNDGEGYRVDVMCVDDIEPQPVPYLSYYVNSEIEHWRERAFKAEAALSKLRHEVTP